MGSD
ncbi:hypothetical protein VTJ04DRAFT_10956 [Mycothermus thermophilus]